MVRAGVCTVACIVAASLLVVPVGAGLSAQQAGGAKHATAVRVPDGAIQLDGQLNEDIWSRATPITDFIQKEPTEGAAPSDRMEVRLVYDGSAVYVGARMYSRDPSAIQAPL